MKKQIFATLLICLLFGGCVFGPIDHADRFKNSTRIWAGYKVAKVRIIDKQKKETIGYMPVTAKFSKKMLDDNIKDFFWSDEDILELFKKYGDGIPLIFTETFYDIPGIDKAFAIEEVKKINVDELAELHFQKWESLEGVSATYMLPKEDIEKATNDLKNGALPLKVNAEDYIKLSYVIPDNVLSPNEIEVLAAYFSSPPIRIPQAIFEASCENNNSVMISLTNEQLRQTITNLQKCNNVKAKFGDERLKQIVEEKAIKLRKALDFFEAVDSYYKFANAEKMIKYLEDNCKNDGKWRSRFENVDFGECARIAVLNRLVLDYEIKYELNKINASYYPDLIEILNGFVKNKKAMKFSRQISVP